MVRAVPGPARCGVVGQYEVWSRVAGTAGHGKVWRGPIRQARQRWARSRLARQVWVGPVWRDVVR